MLGHGIFILTRNSQHDKIFITNPRAIAQLGRAPRLHMRQCFFRGVHKRFIEKSMSYSRLLGNNSLTKQVVRSNSGAFLGAQENPSLI